MRCNCPSDTVCTCYKRGNRLGGNLLQTGEQIQTGAKHSRVPAEITADPRLKPVDVRVFSGLALFERGGMVKVGYRWLGKSCNVRISHLKNSLDRLAQHGYVVVTAKAKFRAEYQLQHQIFTGRTAKKGEIAVPDAAKSVTCAKCSTACKSVGKAGLCRNCMLVAKVADIIRASPESTEEEIYVRLKTRDAKGVRAAIRKVKAA